MSQQQKDNSGALFKNDKKQHENQPDYNGQCTIGGIDFWMSAWLKEAQSGRKYMSFSFTPKQASSPAPAPAPRPNAYAQANGRPQPAGDVDSDIPF